MPVGWQAEDGQKLDGPGVGYRSRYRRRRLRQDPHDTGERAVFGPRG